ARTSSDPEAGVAAYIGLTGVGGYQECPEAAGLAVTAERQDNADDVPDDDLRLYIQGRERRNEQGKQGWVKVVPAAWAGDLIGFTPVEEGGAGRGVDREIGPVEIEVIGMSLGAFADIEPAPDGQAYNQSDGHVAEPNFSGGEKKPRRLPVRRAQNWWPDGPLVFDLIFAHCPGLSLCKPESVPAHLRHELISIKPTHRDSPLPPFPFAPSRKRPHPFFSAWSDCHGGLSRPLPEGNPVNQSRE